MNHEWLRMEKRALRRAEIMREKFKCEPLAIYAEDTARVARERASGNHKARKTPMIELLGPRK